MSMPVRTGPVAIMGAMDCEIESISNLMSRVEESPGPFGPILRGMIGNQEAVLCRSGVGKVYSALCTQYLETHYSPRALVFAGIAGGTGEGIRIGDTLIASDLVHHDMDARGLGFPRGEIPYSGKRFFAAHPLLLDRARKYQPESGRLHVGRICTGDRFMDLGDLEACSYLLGEFNAIGVEMEGAAVAQAADLLGLPCLVMRTVSDNADSGAASDFQAFLPLAGHNAAGFISWMLGDFPL